MRIPILRATSSATTYAGVTPQREIDPTFVGNLLAPLKLDAPARENLERTLVAELRKRAIDPSAIAAALKADDVQTAEIEFLSKSLLTYVALPDPRGPNAVLSAITAAATTDRLYSTVELYSFNGEHFSARLVSATAVSNADTAVRSGDSTATQQLRDFRQRTSDFLTALNDGGPIAVHVGGNYTLQSKAQTTGLVFSAVGTAAKSGTLQNAQNALFGLLTEIKLFVRDTPKSSQPEPSQLVVTFRSGFRRASANGLLEGDPRTRTLAFAQGMFEGRAPFAKVPVGVTITGVNSAFRPYSVAFQVYGMAGF